MKKVLYFFPDDLGAQNAGNITRAMHLLQYFKSRQYQVDFVSIRNEKAGPDADEHTLNLLNQKQLVNRVHLLPRKPGKKNPLFYFFRYKLWDLIYYLVTFPLKSNIPTFMTLVLKKAFERLLKQEQYDFIVISYIYYADLVGNKSLTQNARLIMDTHDFITAQFKDKRGFNLGATFADEVSRLNTFDDVWAISAEERYLFNQFTNTRVNLVPMMMDEPQLTYKPVAEREFDLIYIASDNIHNQRSAKWFFEQVYPMLPAGIRICVIGKINQFISAGINITRVSFAPNLDTYYNNARVALCPMLSGTGVKVKVVEALAHGIPVVCTEYGTDGLPNKIDNGCLVSNNPAGYAQLITQLLTNPQLYAQQQAFARRLFDQYFKTEVSYKLLDEVFAV